MKKFEVPYDVHIYSAHRTPLLASEFAKNARKNDIAIIIAAAGMAAHLDAAMAANTTLPIIGIPCSSSILDGIDALLSTVQMPSGLPVATVAITDDVLAQKLNNQRKEEEKKIIDKNEKLLKKYR